MAKLSKVKAAPARPEPQVARDACLVHIYPTGPEMGARYTLTEISLILGRDPACEIPINNLFVSRHHARIQPVRDGYEVADLQSTNGTFVNEVRVTGQKLKDGDYLRIGNCIFRFLEGGNIEAEYHEEIHRLTIMDALTGTFNQRYFLEYLDQELARAANTKRPLALVLFDLDRFKAINDQLGHLGGDHTLRELSGCLKAQIRDPDIFARYGGEEFAVVMPETTLEQAAVRAEQFRQAVAQHAFRYEDQPYAVTISLGVAVYSGANTLPASEFIRQADEKMYQAKQAGRNRVVA